MAEAGDTYFVLGVDFGTTAVKVVVVDPVTRNPLYSQSLATLAGGHEQDVHTIFSALQSCLSSISAEILSRVKLVGICGQMHGVVFWHDKTFRQNGQLGEVSSLYTWEDDRCSPEFLGTLPKSPTNIASGYGCATIFWLKQYQPDVLDRYNCAGTVQDLFVAFLCDLKKPVMSFQNAESWGYFSSVDGKWVTERLNEFEFITELLPTVKQPGELAGVVKESWCRIPSMAKVGVALGDMQCSVYSVLETDNDAILNIGTSAQLSFLMPKSFHPVTPSPESTIQYLPYFHQRFLAVAASLNGGNVVANFAKVLKQWSHELGNEVSESNIMETISISAINDSSLNDPVIIPTIFGERHSPKQRAAITGITSNNLTLGNISRALFRGIITNLETMMPKSTLASSGVNRILGTGSALTKNGFLQDEVRKQFCLPLIIKIGTDAALGAAVALHDMVSAS